jgi:hypothetical protein
MSAETGAGMLSKWPAFTARAYSLVALDQYAASAGHCSLYWDETLRLMVASSDLPAASVDPTVLGDQ